MHMTYMSILGVVCTCSMCVGVLRSAFMEMKYFFYRMSASTYIEVFMG